MKLPPTASQTVGPFFSIGMGHLFQPDTPVPASPASPITLRGTIFDADHHPIPDAVLEFWCAQKFLRVPTNPTGVFTLVTHKPAAIAHSAGESQMPHFNVLLFMRGLLKPVFTRVYFSDEASPPNDPVSKLVSRDRLPTLLALPQETPGHYLWNIVMQGANETVFFEF